MHTRGALLFVLGLFLIAPHALPQGDREGQGLGREQMWPAPTAEDWAKPCLITWQRTWDDAVTVSKETGKPILICINMDGEIASEHYAGVRYRQPEVAALYKPYVTVVASTYRHNPRDYDDEGKRIECPRFGGVTCGEHIWIEPIIFEKFCDGRRIAPRHICVDLDGKEVYDVMLTNDTQSVFDAVREGRKLLPPGKTIVRSDRPLLERVASRHSVDRMAVEGAYEKGDAATRRAILEAAMKHRDKGQLDLLRLAVFGLDTDLSRTARSALAKSTDPNATDLIGEAMRVPMTKDERDALIAALKRLGSESPLARWLAAAHKGLSGAPSTVDPSKWKRGGEYPAPRLSFGGFGRASHVESTAKAAAERPMDPAVKLDLAEATLALALKANKTYASNPRLARLAERHLYGDARKLAAEAAELGATPWRAHAVQALAAYYGGDREKGYEHAERAVKELPAGDTGWNSMAVLTIFAEARWKAIKAAVKAKEDYPSEWLTDLHAAYSVLLEHPLGTEGQVLWHYELMVWLRAYYRAVRVLRDGLTRFKDSPRLHEKLRERLLRFRGPKGLEEGYAQLMKKLDDPARVAPFAGYASVVAGDQYRRMRRFEQALESYERGIAYYETAVEADKRHRAQADHAIAMAHAARARVFYQLERDDAALDAMLASFGRRAESAGTRDEMGITPGETAQMLLARLKSNEKTDAAKRLEDALAKVDPALLRPDIGILPGR